MSRINIQTTSRIIPMIYAYSTPEVPKRDGWVKIGYTEQDVDKRIKQQTHTAGLKYNKEWQGTAIFDDGSGEVFHDTDFHAYLSKLGIEREEGHEWFHINGILSKGHFRDFKENRGIPDSSSSEVISYVLRDEQNKAVEQTIEYFKGNEAGEFLWNAKPRFGKTLSVYDFCKRIDAHNILIVTNRPAIANSWYSDYERFLGKESGYLFVSSTDSLKGKKYVITREEYSKIASRSDDILGCIEFVSLQDLKGSIYFGGQHDKLVEISDDPKRGQTWDVLIIDEAHEGVDTYKTDVAFDHIKRKFTLHLSGTPFKALANDKFSEKAIFNWTYADEQKAKESWEKEAENPYSNLPKLNLFTYQMSEIVKEELEQGIEIQGETEEYAFDLNEFFKTKANGKFEHESSVDKFLDALTKQEKFPFSTEELRNELKHTFWLLNRVDSAKALAKKLREHEVFKDYEIVLAAGDGKIDDQDETKKSFDKVKKAIAENEKTITLSVGQLTTGVTIPEWTAVLMLSNVKSPALYMQAAFRAQNPYSFSKAGQFYRKENAYVFDFDPARTLTIFEEFANDLSTETSDGRGDSDKRKDNVRTLLNFFPVIGEDENGEMIELDAEKVLSIPRKIRSREVVKRGFMSDFLFQNISNVFHAPMEVIEIIQNFTAVQEPKKGVDITENTAKDLSVDKDGNVSIPNEQVIGKSAEIFGEKIFEDVPNKLKETIDSIHTSEEKPEEDALDKLKNIFHKEAVNVVMETAQHEYGADLRKSDKNRLERKLKNDSDRMVNKAFGEYTITGNKLEKEREERLETCKTKEEIESVNQEYNKKQDEALTTLKKNLSDAADDFVKSAGEDVVRTVETQKKEQKKKGIEDSVKDHLRGFSRTIPSFLMAYGDETVTLANFDKVIPDNVFKEVTSISLDDFIFLRDGGDYTDQETGEKKHFDGKLFDPVVFDDSVKEFLRLKARLANYFEEMNKEDIFDYIPPQKTNQIFTPKWVVKKMVDMLEAENPGCFDKDDQTFMDLYMKSGLYIAEIVKRLYQSKEMKRLYPDDKERLKHIFKKQVYGLAPTEIIYKIATNFILGFNEDVSDMEHNFKQADALEPAKEGQLSQFLDELYGGGK
jgi:superfamily II DNA or RNA helicase